MININSNKINFKDLLTAIIIMVDKLIPYNLTFCLFI